MVATAPAAVIPVRSPCAIRAARAPPWGSQSRMVLPIGKGRILREGSRIAILSLGTRLKKP